MYAVFAEMIRFTILIPWCQLGQQGTIHYVIYAFNGGVMTVITNCVRHEVAPARVLKKDSIKVNLHSVLRTANPLDTGLSKSTKRASGHVLQNQRDRFNALDDLVALVFADIPFGGEVPVIDPRFMFSDGVAEKDSDLMEPRKQREWEDTHNSED
jgi:hypothetical protein